MTPRADDDGMRVVGGVGGTRVCLEALAATAARVERAGRHLEAAAVRAEAVARQVDRSASWSPPTAALVRDEAAPLLSSWGGLRDRAARAHETAADLRATARLYATADLDATRALRRAGIAVGGVIGETGPIGVLVATEVTAIGLVAAGTLLIGLRLLRHTNTPHGLTLRWLGHERFRRMDGPAGFVARTLGGPGLLPEELGPPSAEATEVVVPGLAAMVRSLSPGRQPASADPVPDAARRARVLGQLCALLGGTPLPGLAVEPVVVGRSVQGPRAAPPVPRSTADLLRAVDDLYESPAGTIGVQSLDHADGTRSWVVAVPGTQHPALGDGAVPTDMGTNLDLISGAPSDMTEAVIRAMHQAGVGPDEVVALAGHSQGGMTVVQVAADPRVVAGFSVTTVLTAGSPVGGMRVPEGVQALHLEHLQDQVVATDGTPNPDAANRTTVVRDLGASGDRADRRAGASLGGAHDLDTYIRTAEHTRDVAHASVQRFDDALARVLGDGTAVVQDHRFVASRVPERR